MTTKTHSYSDGSQIEQGADAGKGWLEVLKAKATTEKPRKRKISGRDALRVDDMTKPE